MTFATAESCTGGQVAQRITALAGASAVYRGGVVSYAIPVKHEVLGVSSKVIDEPSLGAVSGECASQMATGARRVMGSDVAVSTTGIAGPTGAELGKPVGTVWFGACAGNRVVTECHLLSGDRRTVRAKAVRIALGLVLEVTENS